MEVLAVIGVIAIVLLLGGAFAPRRSYTSYFPMLGNPVPPPPDPAWVGEEPRFVLPPGVPPKPMRQHDTDETS